MMNTFKWQKCAIGCLWFGNRIMLCKRKKGIYQDLFGVIGGKVDEGERIDDGLSREIYEEAGAFIWSGELELKDVYIVKPSQLKVFVFESFRPEFTFQEIKNTEPKKHGKWTLYTQKEALKLPLTPYLQDYLANFKMPTK